MSSFDWVGDVYPAFAEFAEMQGMFFGGRRGTARLLFSTPPSLQDAGTSLRSSQSGSSAPRETYFPCYDLEMVQIVPHHLCNMAVLPVALGAPSSTASSGNCVVRVAFFEN